MLWNEIIETRENPGPSLIKLEGRTYRTWRETSDTLWSCFLPYGTHWRTCFLVITWPLSSLSSHFETYLLVTHMCTSASLPGPLGFARTSCTGTNELHSPWDKGQGSLSLGFPQASQAILEFCCEDGGLRLLSTKCWPALLHTPL